MKIDGVVNSIPAEGLTLTGWRETSFPHTLEAVDQVIDRYSYTSKNNWTPRIGPQLNGRQIQISAANNTYTANFNTATGVVFQNYFVGVSSGGIFKVNGVQVNAPYTVYLSAGNTVTVEAPSQIVNGVQYNFLNWQYYDFQNPRTFNTSSDYINTAYYQGKPTPTPNVQINENMVVNQPIHITWSEHPNANVTQYNIYRKVKHSKYYGFEGPILLAALQRGVTSYYDYDYVYTNGYTDDLLWYDVRAFYKPEQTFADSNYLAVFGAGGRFIAKANDGNNDKIILSKDAIPDKYNLDQNYPNPFNPGTQIKYAIKDAGFVTIEVFDVLGRLITTLVNEEKPAGYFTVNFDAAGLSSGIYFYTIKTNGFFDRKKMILLR